MNSNTEYEAGCSEMKAETVTMAKSLEKIAASIEKTNAVLENLEKAFYAKHPELHPEVILRAIAADKDIELDAGLFDQIVTWAIMGLGITWIIFILLLWAVLNPSVDADAYEREQAFAMFGRLVAWALVPSGVVFAVIYTIIAPHLAKKKKTE